MKNVEIKVGGQVYRVSPTKAIKILESVSHGKPVYYSKSKDEFLVIEEMADNHIKNALNRLVIDYFTDLIKEKNNLVYLEKFKDFTDIPEVVELAAELQKRVSESLKASYA